MQGHVVNGQQRIVENQHEQHRFLAAINEKVDSIREKVDRIAENRSNNQLLHTLTSCFDDPRILSTYSLGSYPIDLSESTNPVASPVSFTA